MAKLNLNLTNDFKKYKTFVKIFVTLIFLN
jgi:hypothetical protein